MPEDVDAASPTTKRSAFAALKHRDFAVFWSSAMLSNAGGWFQMLTVPYALDQLTHSTAVVGLGVLISFLPQSIAGPIGGSLADRYSRRTILLWSQAAQMATSAGMAVLWESGAATPVNLLALVVIYSIASGLANGPWFAFVTELVPKEDLVNAVSMNILQYQGAKAIGPALGGLILATLGPGGAFLGNALSFLIVIGGLLMIPSRHVADPDAHHDPVWTHMRDGMRYVRERQVLAVAVMTGLAIAFFAHAMFQLTEPYSRRDLHVGAGAFGLLVTLFGGGAIVASLCTVYASRTRRSRMIMFALGLAASSVAGLALAPNFFFAAIALTGLGAAWVFAQNPLQGAVQSNVHETHRGRVISLYIAAFSLGVPLGGFVGGVFGALFGLRATFAVASLCLFTYTAYAIVRYDRLRLFDQTIDHTEQIRADEHA